MPGVEVSAKLLKCGHVKFLDIRVVRNSPFGLLHALGDSASKADVILIVSILSRRTFPASREATAAALPPEAM